MVAKVMSENAKDLEATAFCAGEEKVVRFLIGLVMREGKGKFPAKCGNSSAHGKTNRLLRGEVIFSSVILSIECVMAWSSLPFYRAIIVTPAPILIRQGAAYLARAGTLLRRPDPVWRRIKHHPCSACVIAHSSLRNAWLLFSRSIGSQGGSIRCMFIVGFLLFSVSIRPVCKLNLNQDHVSGRQTVKVVPTLGVLSTAI